MSKSVAELILDVAEYNQKTLSDKEFEERKAAFRKLIEDSEKEFAERAERMRMKPEDLNRTYTL